MSTVCLPPHFKYKGGRFNLTWQIWGHVSVFCFFLNPHYCGTATLKISVCLSGSGKVESVRAVDVLTVLREKVAFVSGKKPSAAHFPLTWFGPVWIDVTQLLACALQVDGTSAVDRS